MKLVLASEFDISFHKTRSYLEKAPTKKVVFIPTAAHGEGFQPDYEDNYKPFEDIGMEVVTFDIEKKTHGELADAMKDVGIIYGGPGNTFYLLEHMQKCNFQEVLFQKLAEGVIYLGSSAGSIVVSPDISFIAPMDEPEKANVADTTGLGLVDFLFLPHCDHPEMGKDAKTIIEKHQSDDLPLYTFNDDQAVYVEDNIIRIL